MEYINDCMHKMATNMEDNLQHTTQQLTVLRLGRSRARCDEKDGARVAWFAHNIMHLDRTPSDDTKLFDNNVGEKYWHSVGDMLQQHTRELDGDWLRSCDSQTRWCHEEGGDAAKLLDVTALALDKSQLGRERQPQLRIEEYVVFDRERPGSQELLMFMYPRDDKPSPFFRSHQTPLKHATHVVRHQHGRQLYDYDGFLRNYRKEQGTLENPYSPNVVKKLQDVELWRVVEHHTQASVVADASEQLLQRTELFRLRFCRLLWIVDSCWVVVMSQCSHRVPATSQPSNYGFDTWEIDLVHVSTFYYLYNTNDVLFSNVSRFLGEYFDTKRVAAPTRPMDNNAMLAKVLWWKYNKLSHQRFSTGPASSLNVKMLTAASFDALVKHTSLYDQLRQRCRYLFSNLPFDVNRGEFEGMCRRNCNQLEPPQNKMLFSTKPDGVLAVVALVAGHDLFVMTRNYTLMRVHNSRAQCQRIRRLLELKYPVNRSCERVFLLEGELVEAHFKASQELHHVAHYSYVPAMMIFSMSQFVCRDGRDSRDGRDDSPAERALLSFLRYTHLTEEEAAVLLRTGHENVRNLDVAARHLQDVMTNDNRLYNMCGCGPHGDDVFCTRTLLQDHEALGVDMVSALRVVQMTPLLMLHKVLFQSLADLTQEYGDMTRSAEDLFPCDSAFEVRLDGLIVAPRLSAFCTKQPQGEIWTPVSDERRKTYKWKPLEKRTMDFVTRVSSCGRQLLMFAMDSDLIMTGERYMLNMDRQTRMLNVHRVALEDVRYGERFCERFLVTKSVKDYFAEAREVHEFSYSPLDEKWIVVGVRRDKKQPNNVVVVSDIMMHLVSTLTLEELLKIERQFLMNKHDSE